VLIVRPRLSPLTIGLATLLAVHAIAVPLALRYLLGVPREDTLVGQVDRLRRAEQREDSWRPMAAARAYVDRQPGRDLYEEIFFRRKIKFQYPPTSLLLVDRLSRAALNGVSWCAVWFTVAVSVASLGAALRRAERPQLRPHSPFEFAVALACAAGLGVTFYPLLKGYTLGQIQVWVDALVAAALWAWVTRWRVAAGISIGLACLIKPPLAVIAVWALARREWRMLGALVTTCALGLALSVAVFGLASHLSYVRVLGYIAQRGEAYYPNQSVNGLLNRWLSNGDNLEFQDFEFSPPNHLVWAGTAAAAVGLLGLALALPALAHRVDRRIDLAIATITATIISPIAWEHHYGVVLPVFSILVPALVDQARAPGRSALWLALSFLLVGQYLAPAQRLAATPFNPLQSYVLAGALLLLAVAYEAVLRPRQVAAPAPPLRTAV
jgi:alpha-1,2-mannosyltransferase